MATWTSKTFGSSNKYITYRLVVIEDSFENGSKTVTLYLQGQKSYLSNQYTQGRGEIVLWISGTKSTKTMTYPDASLRLVPGKGWITLHKYTKSGITSANFMVSGGIDFSNSSINGDMNTGDQMTTYLTAPFTNYTYNYNNGEASAIEKVNYGNSSHPENYSPTVILEGKYWGGWEIDANDKTVYNGKWIDETYQFKTKQETFIDVKYNNSLNNNIFNSIPKKRPGYKFLGWTDENGNDIYDASGEAIPGVYWNENKIFCKKDLNNSDVITMIEQWKLQNISYINIGNEWALSIVYMRTENGWSPIIIYTKTDDGWSQSVTK